MTEITCLVDAKALLGEATVWDPQAGVLWWVDIWGPSIHRYDPATGKDQIFGAPEYLGCLGMREKGGLVVTMTSGFYFFDPETGKYDPIVDPEADLPDTRFNDGKPDRQGRFWSGSMFEAFMPGKTEPRMIASLWRLDADLSCHRVLEGIGCSNGLAWSPDSRIMYFSDSHTNLVWAFDFDAATGDVENRRVFIDLTDEGYIVDGATVDADGCYWLTVPFKGKVRQYDPDGKLMRTIDLPTDLPTCCEFGGKDLDMLYVTTATLRRPADKIAGSGPAGGLYAIDVGVKGLLLPAFKG